jgi:hypothetical protein
LAHSLLARFIFEIARSQKSAAIEKAAVHEDVEEVNEHGIKQITLRGATLFFKQSSPPTHSQSVLSCSRRGLQPPVGQQSPSHGHPHRLACALRYRATAKKAFKKNAEEEN